MSDEEQLIDGAGSFWGSIDPKPKLPPPWITPKEWEPSERVEIVNQEAEEAHEKLHQMDCMNLSCRIHHEEDCFCDLCEIDGVNGYEHREHETCEDCESCIDCGDCECG